MTQYRYLIGFMTYRNGMGYGTVDVDRPEPITCQQDVTAVQDLLRRHTDDANLVVLSFSRYTDPAGR